MISVLQQAEQPIPQEAVEEQGEFEIVMGRGQMASTMLLVLVLLVVFSGGAYVVGRYAAPKPAAPQFVTTDVPQPEPTPISEVTPVQRPEEIPGPVVANRSAPVYANPEQGKVYLQVGAIDRGLAGIWAEGLRTHGLPGFVAPGPSAQIWRVVIGPLPTPESYQEAKATLSRLGIDTFGRKYQ